MRLWMLVRAAAAEVYYLAMTTATIVSTLGLAGIGCAALRTVAAYASSGMWDDVRRGNRAVYLSHAALAMRRHGSDRAQRRPPMARLAIMFLMRHFE